MLTTRNVAKWFSNYENQQSPGSKLRAKRIDPLLKMIEAVHREKGSVSIIDLGGTRKYWGIVPDEFLREHNVSITVVNLPGSRKPEDQGVFRFVEGDACKLDCFKDKAFDIAHSNSVVEHVGDWEKMVSFSRELKRVSSYYFCQTPNYWFPVEPHFMMPFFHWLPKPMRLWLVMHFDLGSWKKATSVHEGVRVVESARLLNRKMFEALFPEATLMTERVFLFSKSFVAVRNEKL